MRSLITGDLHLTERPKDEYRWELFPWMMKQVKEHKIDQVVILGDLTQAKDRHQERLVRSIVTDIVNLSMVARVIFVAGNHDGIEEGHPFFGFVNHLENVTCVETPLSTYPILYLPHTRNHEAAWKDLDFSHYDYVFCHQTFQGAHSETGIELPGIPASLFDSVQKRVISGDVHVPQKMGRKIIYAGAPYHIYFGDKFKARVLMLDHRTNNLTELHFPTILKTTIDLSGEQIIERFYKELARLEVDIGDQIKVRVELSRANYPLWPELKKQIREIADGSKIDMTGPELRAAPEEVAPKSTVKNTKHLSREEIVAGWCKKNNVDASLKASGLQFLKGK